jgi:tRNA nucleotidyltransferase (CCA-adding enzyme)
MKLYVVGGAVRDRLLGAPATDRDWVAVGATPEQLLALGYKPVGKDFPVFLHPLTNEEVALARTERKSAPGYHGFVFHAAPEVTLEQDLVRRDLTINAMAEDESGQIIDPHGGQRDLLARLLRHVSPAFAEDPVRLLRLARFAARWPTFTVAAETQTLLTNMVQAGEVDALVSERVWQELARGLMAAQPSRMFEVLAACGALQRLLPEIASGLAPGSSALVALELALEAQQEVPQQAPQPVPQPVPLTVRYALLPWPDVPAVQAVSERLRVAELTLRERPTVLASGALGAAGCVALFNRCDAWRRPQRFEQLLQVCAFSAPDPAGSAAPLDRLRQCLRAACAINTAQVAQAASAHGAQGPAVGAAIEAARTEAVRQQG